MAVVQLWTESEGAGEDGGLGASPRSLLGLLALGVYLVIIVVIHGTSGVPYAELSASPGCLLRDAVLSIAVASVVVSAPAT